MDQLLFNRPVPGYAQYRAPVRGMYMCGSSTHPGRRRHGRARRECRPRGAARPRAGRIERGRRRQRNRATTASSSAAVTMDWCARPLWRAAAARCWCSRRRAQVGGAAVTREFAPGFRVSAGAHLLHLMPADLLRELRLESHGLEWAAQAHGHHGAAARRRAAGLESGGRPNRRQRPVGRGCAGVLRRTRRACGASPRLWCLCSRACRRVSARRPGPIVSRCCASAGRYAGWGGATCASCCESAA